MMLPDRCGERRALSIRHAAALVLAGMVLAGCASRTSAPVVTRAPSSSTVPAASPAPSVARSVDRSFDNGAEFYIVKRGDTLYSIALDHGTSYRELAEWNNITNPNVIRVDQVLRVRAPTQQSGVQVRPLADAANVESRPLPGPAVQPSSPQASSPKSATAPGNAIKSEPKAVKLPYSDENLALLSRPQPQPQPQLASPALAQAKPQSPEAQPATQEKPAPAQSDAAEDDEKVDWGWPTAGRVTAPFSEGGNKGLDIGGKSGQPVVASASGTVLYVGSGIRGYGKLIVLRHNKAYSTVYAHNSEILVKEGQHVVKGQKIAEMGNTDADQVTLHFEIRRLGKPVDPARLLPAS